MSKKIAAAFPVLLALALARSPTTTIKCDSQPKEQSGSQQCRLSSRFYDVDSWQIERNRAITHLAIVDLQAESLPTGVAESFPNLLSYVASDTSFKSAKKENFRNLKRLETLELRNGQLARIRRDAFEDLESLVRLDLGNNMLKLMSAEYFRELGRLEFLAFNDNEVEELSARTFRNLLNLKSLNGDRNQLYMIGAETFDSNKKLRSISFKDNNLRFIDSMSFSGLDELKTVDLSGNQCIDQRYEVNERVKKFLGAIRKDVTELCQNGVKE